MIEWYISKKSSNIGEHWQTTAPPPKGRRNVVGMFTVYEVIKSCTPLKQQKNHGSQFMVPLNQPNSHRPLQVCFCFFLGGIGLPVHPARWAWCPSCGVERCQGQGGWWCLWRCGVFFWCFFWWGTPTSTRPCSMGNWMVLDGLGWFWGPQLFERPSLWELKNG